MMENLDHMCENDEKWSKMVKDAQVGLKYGKNLADEYDVPSISTMVKEWYTW